LHPEQKKQKQKRNRTIFRSAILVILFGAIVFSIFSNLQADHSVYKPGDAAPDFKLKQINDQNKIDTIQLSDLKGNGVMLNFWATWCDPCASEMPYMQSLYNAYNDKGIEIVAVSLDGTELVVDQFIDTYQITFPVPHDREEQVRDLYRVGPIPSSFFINPNGKIEHIVYGTLTLDRLEGYLQDIQPEEL